VVLVIMALVIVLATAVYLGARATPGGQPLGSVELTLGEEAAKGLGDTFGSAAGQAAPMAAALEPLSLEASADDGAVAESETRVDDAMIVRTAGLELEVEDVAASLPAARSAITGLGGYVSGSDEYDQGETRWASATYRVPVDRFGDAIDALRGLAARVVRESTQSTEVTATVVDLDARIANLRASEAALVEIMDRAGRIEDVLSVQMRLEDVRGQIEMLEAQRANLADQAALSTITVSWFTPVAAVAIAREGWDLGSEVDVALAQTVAALQRVASLAVWFAVVVLPLLGVPLLAALGLAVILRRRGRDSAHATD
jgi:hypothetical protein